MQSEKNQDRERLDYKTLLANAKQALKLVAMSTTGYTYAI